MNEAGSWNWQELVADLSIGVMLLDFNARKLLWQNRAMQDLFSAPPDAAEYFLGEFRVDQPGAASRKVIEQAGKAIGFTVHHAANGLGLVLAADITELARQRRAGETASLMHTLDYTFFSLAHELGNPINSIKMTLDVLINNYDAYDAETRLEYLRSIHAEFRRLEELLKAIRSFNQFDHLASKPADVRALVQNLLQMLQGEITEKKISLRVSFPDAPAQAACDPRALHQALLNIISNSIDALAGRPDALLAIAVSGDGGLCRIRVADNGCGIAAERRKEAFLPFFSSKPHGVGLGLTMVKKLVTRMNGTVELNSLSPQGTEVLIALPAADSHAD